jgi:predicted porin
MNKPNPDKANQTRLKTVMCLCLLLISGYSLLAQETDAEKVGDWGSLYGSLRYHLALDLGDNPTLQLESNSTRFGLDIKRKIGPIITALGRIEFSLLLGEGGRTLDASSGSLTTNDDFPLGLRLSYLGLNFGKPGTLLAGKIWSVYYDVTQYTDKINVGDVTASGTYALGLDGGATGTGRADNALAYRMSLGGFNLGLQSQFRVDDNWLSGVAASVQYRTRIGLTAGVAANYTIPPADDLAAWRALTGSRDYLFTSTAALKFSRESLYLAVLGSYQLGNEAIYDVAYIPTNVTVIYDAYGIEFAGSYKILEWLTALYGFNYMKPISDISPANANYVIHKHFFEVDFFLIHDFYIYLEYLLDLGIDSAGFSQPDAVFLGLRYTFNLAF